MHLPSAASLLAAQLDYVGNNVPYFRESGCNDGRPINEFPFTFKPQIRNNYAAFISDEFRGVRPSLVNFITAEHIHEEYSEGMPPEVPFGDDIIVGETTGTSGSVFRCPKTLADRFRLSIGIWRQRRSVDPLAKPSNLFPLIHTGLRPAYDPFDCDLSNLKPIYEEIRKGRYRWLHFQAHLLRRHVAAFRHLGWYPVLPDLKYLEFTGYFLQKEEATELSRFFGTEIIDNYGMLETWAIAITCRHGALHINEHNVYIEIIDEKDRPVRLGEVGRIVVTSLQERLLPFIRYVTDDFGMFTEKLCDCKLGGKVLALVEGRAGSLIKGVPGRVFGNLFFTEALRKIAHFDILCIRIRQMSSGEFVVQTNPIRNPAELVAKLAEEIRMLSGERPRFRHVTLDAAEMAVLERQKPWLFRCEC